ncbi:MULTISPECIES: hypothetical protein [unclassified Microbacterium]|uniref:hypothetical protein n=1 Tax=unclassified Microbacterium TaxID=2609290 RepID=UPI001600670D|nr:MULTISPECIES: hypothetical protein [unclassified Microbacterium]MBT2484800.1 hypothetical protein [Microbacterium sp. ISL-108]
MTRTEWDDQRTALAERIDRFPTRKHPAVRPLIREHDRLTEYGLQHEFISPAEAARA